jgi:hypothetical protein
MSELVREAVHTATTIVAPRADVARRGMHSLVHNERGTICDVRGAAAGRIKPDDPNEDDGDVEDARARYIRNLINAWRTPGRVDAGYRNAVRRPEKMVIGAGPGVVGPGPDIVGVGPTDSLHRPKIVDEQTIRDARARAKASLEERNRNLENAWKTL